MDSNFRTFEMAKERLRSGEDPLFVFLRDARENPVQVLVHPVERLDALRLQTLLCAKKQWELDGIAFELLNVTENVRHRLALLGLNENEFENEAET